MFGVGDPLPIVYAWRMQIVEKSTDSDLEAILAWLETEYYEDDESGFWCNRRLIVQAHEEGDDLFVVRSDGSPVSFQVGRYAPSIVSTRKTHRRQGCADALLKASIQRSRSDSVNVLDIECAPRSSWPFWQKRGFKRFGDLSEFGRIDARMILDTPHILPGGPRRDVRIDFFPEKVKYAEDIEALYGWSVEAALGPDGSYQLPRRLIGIKSDARGGDMVVRILLGGHQLYFDKAKYEEAEEFGVCEDHRGGSFYIDRIEPGAEYPGAESDG